MAQQLVAHDLGVEAIAADGHAVGGDDVGAAIGAPPPLGPEAHDGEVGGAGAEVGHQHELVGAQRRLVGERGGDRLDDEAHLA